MVPRDENDKRRTVNVVVAYVKLTIEPGVRVLLNHAMKNVTDGGMRNVAGEGGGNVDAITLEHAARVFNDADAVGSNVAGGHALGFQFVGEDPMQKSSNIASHGNDWDFNLASKSG
jgi:hypothetical protein